MRNKVWLVVLFMLGILVGLGATSAFAQEPTQLPVQPWQQQMRDACVSGDYEAMANLHEQCLASTGNTTGGIWGPGGMMRGWQGQSGVTGNAWNGMMGGGRGGMMGNW